VSVRTTGRLHLEPIGPCEIGREGLVFARDVLAAQGVVAFTERHNVNSRGVMERIGMTYTGEIRWRGLVEGQTEQQDAAPFAVYLTQLTGS